MLKTTTKSHLKKQQQKNNKQPKALAKRKIAKAKRNTLQNIQKRKFSSDSSLGFSWPVSRKLDGVVNMEAFATQSPEIIDQIWTDYHATTSTSVGFSINSQQYEKLKQRGAATPFFVHPVVRDTGFFVMLSQFQDNAFLLTYLEDFKQNPLNAQPYMTVTIYDEMQHTKDLVLVRSDICALQTIGKQDADFITRTLIQSYADDDMYGNVFTFNKHPNEFNFDQYIQDTLKISADHSNNTNSTPTDAI